MSSQRRDAVALLTAHVLSTAPLSSTHVMARSRRFCWSSSRSPDTTLVRWSLAVALGLLLGVLVMVLLAPGTGWRGVLVLALLLGPLFGLPAVPAACGFNYVMRTCSDSPPAESAPSCCWPRTVGRSNRHRIERRHPLPRTGGVIPDATLPARLSAPVPT